MDKQNDSLQTIAKKIKESGCAFIYSHVSPDGDGLGASVALQKSLAYLGIKAYILMEDEIPDCIDFIVNDSVRYKYDDLGNPDICIALDCADENRFPKRKGLFFGAKTTVNIDHHKSNRYFAGLNYVDAEKGATCEIMYTLIQELGVPISPEIATALYVGIATDTGRFQYSNTNAATHFLVAALYEAGINIVEISKCVFQSDTIAKKRLIGKMFGSIEMFFDGKAAVACITQDMLTETGTNLGDTEEVINEIRDLKHVEVAVLLKEIKGKATRVSLRSKEYVDVNEIAARLGGGGHSRAAGCMLDSSISETKKLLLEELNKYGL